jgi:DNA-binding CsgD family transcriptional regulator
MLKAACHKFDDTRPIVLAGTDGVVIAQNKPARRILGPGSGKYCWDVFGKLEVDDGETLPCRRGCVMELLESGMDCSEHGQFKLGGKYHNLSCVPANGMVVSTLSPTSSEAPQVWQSLSPRELEILLLLANSETTSSVATRLGIRESTVRSHVENMRNKLGVNTRAAVVAEGFRLGYLD